MRIKHTKKPNSILVLKLILKTPITYKSQFLGKGKGFGSVVNWCREEHEIESVSWVLGVQGLKQEGNCKSRVLTFSTLITNSRLGELSLCIWIHWCVWYDSKFIGFLTWVMDDVHFRILCTVNVNWLVGHLGVKSCVLYWV